MGVYVYFCLGSLTDDPLGRLGGRHGARVLCRSRRGTRGRCLSRSRKPRQRRRRSLPGDSVRMPPREKWGKKQHHKKRGVAGSGRCTCTIACSKSRRCDCELRTCPDLCIFLSRHDQFLLTGEETALTLVSEWIESCPSLAPSPLPGRFGLRAHMK